MPSDPGSRWQMTLFNTIFGPLIELKSVIFRKISPPGPGSRRKIYFKQQRFLELYPYLYPVQLPNYLRAVPGTGRKTLRYISQTWAAGHKVKSSQSHDFDFSYSKNKSQVKSLTFFKVNDLTLTFFFWAESQVIDLTFRWLDLTFLPTKVSKLSLNWSNLTQISPLCSDLL